MRWSWIALGAGAYLAFTLATVPASTAYHWLAPDALRLSGISGTVWSGSAALGSVPGLPLRDVSWRLSAGPLLLGRLSGELEARLAEGFVNTSVNATPSRVQLENARASTQLATIRDVLPLPIGDAAAELSLSLERFVLVDDWPVNAVGTVRIGRLVVPPLISASEGPLVDVGSFTIELTDSGGDGLVGTVRDDGGPLEIAEGTLRLGTDRRYELSGLVRPRASASEELVQGVGMMTGEPDADGLHAFEFTGSL